MSIKTLYRKYRSQTFAEVVSQQHVKQTIQNQIATENVSHAYLFCGPRGIGKTTIARLLAKSLNCEKRKQGEFEPCNSCNSCKQALKGSFIDIIEIDAASNRGINEIKELREHVKYSPQKGSVKTFIIDEAHMLTGEAFNALLKTLEEPPAHALFILATTEVHKLPETIISRCQRFDFRRIPLNELVLHLQSICSNEKVEVDKDVLQTVAIRSEGCLRDAISVLGQLTTLGSKISWKEAELVIPRSEHVKMDEFLVCLLNKDARSAVELINNLHNDGVDLERFNLDFIGFAREQLVYKITGVSSSILELSKEASSAVSKACEADLKNILKVFIDKVFMLKNLYELPQLPMEIGIVEITLPASASSFAAENAHSAKPAQEPEDPAKSEFKPDSRAVAENDSSVQKQDGASARSPESVYAHASPQKDDAPDGKAQEYFNIPKKPFKEVGIEDVLAKWAEFLEEAKKHNNSLPVALNASEPLRVAVENNHQVLYIGFKYKLHRDAILNAENRIILERILTSLFDTNMHAKGELKEYINNAAINGDSKQKRADKADDNAFKEEFGDFIVED